MKSNVFRVIRVVVGAILVVAGVIGLLLPVVPQWPFLIPGLLLLAPESARIRGVLARVRKRLPGDWRKRLRAWRDRLGLKPRKPAKGAPPGEVAPGGSGAVESPTAGGGRSGGARR